MHFAGIFQFHRLSFAVVAELYYSQTDAKFRIEANFVEIP